MAITQAKTKRRVIPRRRFVMGPRYSIRGLSLVSAKKERRFFDAEARRLFAMSGEEFVHQLKSGAFDNIKNTSQYSDVRYLTMLSRAGQPQS